MKNFTTLLFILLTTLIYSQTPSIDEINLVANNFIGIKNIRQSNRLKSTEIYYVRDVKPVKIENKTLFNVAELEPQGFIILSNNRGIKPIIAYSYNSNFDYTADSTNILYHFLSQDLISRENKLNKAKDLWINEMSLLKSETDKLFIQWPEEGATSTGGWINTSWDQSSPYNDMCPLLNEFNRAAAGCVPIAVAQLVNYHKYIGDYTLNTNDVYTTYTNGYAIDSDSTILDIPSFYQLNNYLNNIRTKYNAEQTITNDDISALIFGIGIGLHADYSYETKAEPRNIPQFLKEKLNYFDANEAGYFNPNGGYNTLSLIDNIINGYPCLLSGNMTGSSERHLYVCDGYNTAGYYHLNIGWGGQGFNIWYALRNEVVETNITFYNIFPKEFIRPYTTNTDNIFFEPTTVNNSIVKELDISNVSMNNIPVNIYSTSIYEISIDNQMFSKSLENYTIQGNSSQKLYIRFTPNSIEKFDGKVIIESEFQNKIIHCLGHGKPPGGSVLVSTIDEAITKQGSPYYIGSDLNTKLDTVVIEAGVELIFLGEYEIRIKKVIYCKGTENDSITFKPYSNDIPWTGIKFPYVSNKSIINYTKFIGAANSNIDKSPFYVVSNLDLSHCSFSDFHSDINNGVLHTTGTNETVNVDRCIFNNNSGGVSGAINCEYGNINITNSIFYNNKAIYGGALVLDTWYGARANLKNLTVVNNEALYGGGIFIFGNNCSFSNLILYSNKGTNANEIYFKQKTEGQYIDVEFSNIDTTSVGWANNDFIRLNHCIHSDPIFVNSESFDFHLSEESLSIDAGNYLDNYLKEPQPNGFCINQGAYGGTEEAAKTIGPKIIISPPDFVQGLTNKSAIKSLQLKVYAGGDESISIDSIYLENSNFHTILSNSKSIDINAGDSIQVEILQDLTNAVLLDTITDTLSIRSGSTIKYIPISTIPIIGTVIESDSIDGILDSLGSPYYFKKNISVRKSKNLTIQANCELYFLPNVLLTIPDSSSLIINGTVGDSVQMSSFIENTSWQGLYFLNSQDNDLTGLVITDCFKSTFGGAAQLENSELKLSNCLFYDNHAAQDGGAIYGFNSKIQIYKSKFAGNSASIEGNGGGAIRSRNSEMEIYNSLFIDNKTRVYGGAINIEEGIYKISNCLFKNNIQSDNSYSGGGAICSMLSIGIIDNCNFIENYGKVGGAIYLDYRNNLKIQNSIFYENTSYLGGYHISVNNDVNNPDTLILENCCITLIDSGWVHKGTENGMLNIINCIYENPLLESEYYLMSTSPCIDKGNNLNLLKTNTDLTGNKRIWDGNGDGESVIDIGCQEFGAPFCETNKTFENVTICEGDSYKGWTKTGEYVENLTSVTGCDSIVTINLTVNDLPEPYFSNNADTLVSINDYSFYQWYDQDGIIEGATSKKYIIVKSGTYYLEVTNSFGCTAMSNGMEIIKTGINDLHKNHFKLIVITNPNNGKFRLRIETGKPGKYQVQLINEVGKIQYEKEIFISGDVFEVDFKLSHLPKGNYFLIVFDGESFNTEQIILQ